jgi:hypothetical protein
MNLPEMIGIWAAVFCTLGIYSFLYRDNPYYKITEHLFVGVATGYTLVMAISQTISPKFYEVVQDAIVNGETKNYWRLGAGVLGCMMLLRLDKKTAWLSTWPLAFVVGTFASLRMTGLAQSDLVGQINGTIIPIYKAGWPIFSWDSSSVFNNIVIIGGVVSVLVYFFFSLEQKGVLKVTGNLGTYFLMVTFGSSYGYTVMARVSLLIGRVEVLCLSATQKYGYASIVIGVIIFGTLFVSDLLKKGTQPPPTQ